MLWRNDCVCKAPPTPLNDSDLLLYRNKNPIKHAVCCSVVRHWHLRLAALALLSITACAGSSDPQPVLLADDEQTSEPTPAVLQRLATSTELIAPVPDVVFTQTMAASGLRISYTTLELKTIAPALTIEQQWIFMQDCVQQVGVAPLVLVREGPVVPFTPADDVVRNENPLSTEIDFIPIASTSTLYGPVIQVSDSDFDGSLGSPSFNLRSIMGRYIWLSLSLSERDYPFACAQQLP